MRKLARIMMLILFISLTSNFFAQEKNQNITPMDTANMLGGVVVDTVDSNNSEQIAKDMAVDLMQRINLTMEQTAEITDILQEYISDAKEINKNKNLNVDEDVDSEKELAYRENVDDEKGDLMDNREAIETDVDALRGKLGTDEDLSELDHETNEEIEDVLEDDQKDAYLFIKKDWWNSIKAKVYGTEKTETEMMETENEIRNNPAEKNVELDDNVREESGEINSDVENETQKMENKTDKMKTDVEESESKIETETEKETKEMKDENSEEIKKE